MKQELDEKLCKEFPSLYRDRRAPMQVTCMCWGFEVGDGWFNLIYRLSKFIENSLNQTCYVWDGKSENSTKYKTGLVVVVDQVKEKFGGLRYYYHLEDDPNVPKSQVDRKLAERAACEIAGAVGFAGSMSYVTCEVCGKPGVTRDSGWIRTLCDDHSEGYRPLSERENDESDA